MRPPGASVPGPGFQGPGEPAEEDSVFRRLLGEAGWAPLHPEVRRRFGVKAEAAHHDAGFMSEIRLSRPGRVLRRAAVPPPPSRALRLALGALRDILR